MDEVVLVDDNNEYVRNIEAPNRDVANALLAIDICNEYSGLGFGRVIATSVLMNIRSTVVMKEEE